MKLSAPDWCFYRGQKPEDYYAMLADLGYRAVEMAPPERWPSARKAGLEILNLSAECIDRGLNRIEHHADLVPKIRDLVSLAADNGIPHLIIFSGRREGQTDAEGRKICRRAIVQVLPLAEQKGVTLVFEMLNIHDHPDYQAECGNYGFELAREVASPNLKVIYDIYHMERMGEDSIGAIADNLELIAHLHVAESPGRGIPLEHGNIKYGLIVPAVARLGYDGYWGMEFVPERDARDELDRAARLFRELEM